MPAKNVRDGIGPRGGGGGGGGSTLIFSYLPMLRSFLGVHNFEFQYFWGFSEN